ncbi:glycoside hydrolase family 3 protein [Conyzicola nivalis]|uniref:Beta-N-acetylhexosaminidase n=1 Tax=Conyzicola nivalis TaxID=1477021 RepID=A0A916SJC6_9MICO|nr:glycoside hydrolase family 3 N-terminal domain-containing protein [Conyzicola nivalis]GGB00445.1 beta-N-acetylhexosaminidase [Conyzicola nivalis]
MKTRSWIVLSAAALMLAGCASPAPQPTATTLPPTPTPTATADPLAGLTLEQRVGQVFMIGTTASAPEAATVSAVRDRFVGGVFLSGRSSDGTAATAAVVAQFTASAPPDRPLLVSTDQEGGQVQVLTGPGFSEMPSALDQGAMDAASLQTSATTWARELASAGVNMNLAPVVDLIASREAATSNPPIGGYDREFAFDAPGIVAHADAFRAGMTAGGVTSVVKHFPGLGAVTANTDDTAGVTDTTTNAQSDSVGIYRSEIASGANVVMMSSAIYAQIDSTAPAVFSPTVVTGLLRDGLEFDGVIMTDDLSGAAQVTAWSPAERAVLAIEAGCDIVLVSRSPSIAAEMIDAVLARAQTDPAFANQVDAAARRVLTLKNAD